MKEYIIPQMDIKLFDGVIRTENGDLTPVVTQVSAPSVPEAQISLQKTFYEKASATTPILSFKWKN